MRVAFDSKRAGRLYLRTILWWSYINVCDVAGPESVECARRVDIATLYVNRIV